MINMSLIPRNYFGDIFEEGGVPFTPFHGGFGLVANGMIPKPTFWTFAFYKKLTVGYEKCVLKTPNLVVVKSTDGYKGIAWNVDTEFSGKKIDLNLEFPVLQADKKTKDNSSGGDSDEKNENKPNVLVTMLVDEQVCNPLKVWHDIGEPANPSKEETALLRQSAEPFVQTKRCSSKISLELKENAVCYFELKSAPINSDRGYTFGRME